MISDKRWTTARTAKSARTTDSQGVYTDISLLLLQVYVCTFSLSLEKKATSLHPSGLHLKHVLSKLRKVVDFFTGHAWLSSIEMGPKVFFVFLSLSALSSFSRGSQCPIQEPIYGKALKDYTFKTLPGRSHFDCLYHCHYEVKCQSYNYDMKDKICEMNNRTKEAKPLNFVTDPARFYMRRGTHRGKDNLKTKAHLLTFDIWFASWSVVFLHTVTLGSTPALPAESCAEIKANEARVVASGNFWLDPESTGEVVLVYCDMNTGG